MKSRFLTALLCAALLSGGCGLAERRGGGYWAGFFDSYYHAHPRCALAGTVSKTTADEAKEQGKWPCPACVDDAQDYGEVAAVARGGTLVLRVPDAWMRERPATESADDFQLSFSNGQDARLALSEQLHGADYRAFLDALEASGTASASGQARVPDIRPGEGGLSMCRRHIGGAWYLVYRPGEIDRERLDDENALDVDLRVSVNALSMQGDILSIRQEAAWGGGDDVLSLAPTPSKNKKGFKQSIESGSESERCELQLAVFEDMDVNICVIHQAPSSAEAISGASLRIEGTNGGIPLSGYADGDDGIFCCVLTDAEYDLLKNGGDTLTCSLEPLFTPDAPE